jgi:hypothetical protein
MRKELSITNNIVLSNSGQNVEYSFQFWNIYGSAFFGKGSIFEQGSEFLL